MENEQDTRSTVYPPDQLPRVIKRKLYVHYRIAGWGAGQIDIWDWHNKDSEKVLLCEVDAVLELPKINKKQLKSKALEVLEEEKQKVLAENHERLKAVQDKIENLLAIEFQPEAA